MRRAMTGPALALVGVSPSADGICRPMAPADCGGVLARLRAIDGVGEVAMLATCRRLEVYLVADDVRVVAPLVAAALAPNTTYTLGGFDVVDHLVRVACGLRSPILGDGQILGQVKRAYAQARAVASTGPVLNRLFEMALWAGKRARHETGFGRGATTAASAAVDLVASLAGPVDRREVVVVGAGETATLAARHLSRLRPTGLTVANRTRAHAEAIAAPIGGRTADLADLPATLAGADIVISATSRAGTVISADMVRQVMSARPARPLLAVDLATPRDIDPAVGTIAGVRLLDLDAVQADAAKNLAARESSVPHIEVIATEAADAFDRWRRGADAADVIRALRARAEVERLEALEGSHGSDLTREALDRTTKRLMNRILHRTLVHLRTLGGTDDGHARLAQWRARLARTERLYHLPTFQ